MDDRQLDALLQRRRFEAPSADLAGRIILAARRAPAPKPVSITGFIGDMFREFALPQPAYAFASVLALGLVLGVSLPGHGNAHETLQDSLFDVDSGSY